MRPSISSVEFLRTGTGKEFARGFVEAFIAVPQPPDPTVPLQEPAAQFDEYAGDFVALTDQYQPVDDFRPHLESVYRDRFIDMCPPEGEARLKYYLEVSKILPFLALLTGNVWKLDTGQYSGYPNPRPERKLSLYHLQWAREAFGWWRANVNRLPYYLKLDRPCRQSPVLDALAAALGDELVSQLPREDKLEVENGCPIC